MASLSLIRYTVDKKYAYSAGVNKDEKNHYEIIHVRIIPIDYLKIGHLTLHKTYKGEGRCFEQCQIVHGFLL